MIQSGQSERRTCAGGSGGRGLLGGAGRLVGGWKVSEEEEEKSEDEDGKAACIQNRVGPKSGSHSNRDWLLKLRLKTQNK